MFTKMHSVGSHSGSQIDRLRILAVSLSVAASPRPRTPSKKLGFLVLSVVVDLETLLFDNYQSECTEVLAKNPFDRREVNQQYGQRKK